MPYFHHELNREANVITVSKSGANAGYVWWHDSPIWSSDSLAIRSLDESRYLTRYICLCLKQKETEIYERQQGTEQAHVYEKHLRDFPIPVLYLELQATLLADYQKLELNCRRLNLAFEEERERVLGKIENLYST